MTTKLGNKTLNLQRCVEWGFTVPPFIAIPANLSAELYINPSRRADLVKDIVSQLKVSRYAVRSSALIEDTANQSLAGQFLTNTNVTAAELSDSIQSVLEHANTYLHGQLDQFSLLIQEYIEPDVFGVTFTRNPTGGREMVMEYGPYRGDQVVGGAVQPQRLALYWNESPTVLPELVQLCKDLEQKFNFPQDIEWCIKDKKCYVLQTRPITTITPEQYKQIQWLEQQLPTDGRYYFAKTELSEIAPRPTPITLDLLQRIYAPAGPVARLYRSYQVRYTDTNPLRIIGNELLIDKERELQGLLPAYSYLSNQQFEPRFSNFSKLPVTLNNLMRLNSITTSNYSELFQQIKNNLETPFSQSQLLDPVVGHFLNDYELIFKINLLAGVAIKKLTHSISREAVHIVDIITSPSLFVDMRSYRVEPPLGVLGNSLDVADESIFLAHDRVTATTSDQVTQWWNNLSEVKQRLLRPCIVEAILYNRLRELGRWLTVKQVGQLRTTLLEQAEQLGFHDPKHIYFAKLEQVIQGTVREQDCVRAHEQYNQANRFVAPTQITSSYVSHATTLHGVSAGVATGHLVTSDSIKKAVHNHEPIILYTEMLSPNLTNYFDQIVGIVSTNGGLLSHLAIIARERHLPVVVGFQLSDRAIKIGDVVTIDGVNGTITL